MNEDFIPYEEAIALRDLGFDEMCFGWWELQLPNHKQLWTDNFGKNSESWLGKSHCAAPMFSQVNRWFQENHGLRFEVMVQAGQHGKDTTPKVSGFWVSLRFKQSVYNDDRDIFSWRGRDKTGFESEREANIYCVKELIKIVKET